MNKIFPSPIAGTYPAYYDKYFSLLEKDKNILQQMNDDGDLFQSYITQLPEEKFNHIYADGKWSVAHVLQHIIDTERILTYRALCIARGETNSLAGFDENLYNKNASMSHKDFHLLGIEFYMVRQATVSLFLGLNEEELTRIGKANNSDVSVIALAHMIVAHSRHHINIIKDRY